MNNSPRMKLLTLCIGAALVQMAGLPALADSGVGVDTVIGNAANPGYAAGVPVERDPDSPPIQRTPTGQMYNYPPLKDEGVAKGQVTGHVDIGGVVNSTQTANSKRNEYTDNNKNGVYLNNFGVATESDGARYFSVNGGGVGRNDQFYDLSIGKYNSWKVRAFYNETKHVFTETWKSLYNGEGTGNLTTGLPKPTIVTTGTYTLGSAGYVGASATCTNTAPCWNYNGTVYGNAVAVAAINGMIGTPNATTGVIATSTGNGATGAVQSNMAAAIAAKLAATPYSELSLIRKKGGARGDITLTENLKAYVSYSLEKRTGARPLAMNDNNTSTEIAEAIDYKTHDILAGLSYADALTQANLRASGSIFRNGISTMDVQFGWLGNAGPMGSIQHGTFDLAPDNTAYNLKGEFARSFPELMHSRFNANVSYGKNKENDALLAPISAAQNADLTSAAATPATNAFFAALANPGYALGVNLNNWNTTSALSRQTAGQEIDNKLADLSWSIRPVEALNLKTNYRFYETVNKGGYVAYNPLTNQFGRGPAGGQAVTTFEVLAAPTAAGGCYTQPGFTQVAGCTTLTATNGLTLANGANVPVFGQARSTKQANYGFAADYDLTNTQSVNAALEREDFHRTFREREKTWENKVKVGYVNRALGDTSLRVSFENDTKRGSEYRYRTFEDLGTGLSGLTINDQLAAYIAAGTINSSGTVLLAPAAVTVNGIKYPALNANLYTRYSTMFRKYDQADRDQKILNTRLNVLAREDLDVGLNMQVKRVKYPNSFYGLEKDDQDSLGVDTSYQPTYETMVTAFYNYQKGTKSMNMNSGIAGTACTAVGQIFSPATCADTSGGSTGARPDASQWSSDTTDTNHILGLGLQNDFGFAKLGVDYTYSRSSTHIAYNYGTGAFSAIAANNTAMATLAGSALPDMTTVQNTITVNLVKPLDKKTTIRGMYRFDSLRVADWHYDGVIHNALAAYDAGTMLLDSGPMNYHVSTFGVFLNYKL